MTGLWLGFRVGASVIGLAFGRRLRPGVGWFAFVCRLRPGVGWLAAWLSLASLILMIAGGSAAVRTIIGSWLRRRHAGWIDDRQRLLAKLHRSLDLQPRSCIRTRQGRRKHPYVRPPLDDIATRQIVGSSSRRLPNFLPGQLVLPIEIIHKAAVERLLFAACQRKNLG